MVHKNVRFDTNMPCGGMQLCSKGAKASEDALLIGGVHLLLVLDRAGIQMQHEAVSIEVVSFSRRAWRPCFQHVDLEFMAFMVSMNIHG